MGDVGDYLCSLVIWIFVRTSVEVAERMDSPEGENAQHLTFTTWDMKLFRMHFPESQSQSLIVLSDDEETMKRPSGENLQLVIVRVEVFWMYRNLKYMSPTSQCFALGDQIAKYDHIKQFYCSYIISVAKAHTAVLSFMVLISFRDSTSHTQIVSS